MGALGQKPLLVAQHTNVAGFLVHLLRQRGHGDAHRRNFAAELGLVVLKSACILQRGLQFSTEPLVFAFQFGRCFFKPLKVRAQRLVAGADRRERAPGARIVGAFLLQRGQDIAERFDQLAEGVLEAVDRVELMAGVDQQVSQHLVVDTDACANLRESAPCCYVCRKVRVGLFSRQLRRWMSVQLGARKRKEVGDRTHGTHPQKLKKTE